MESIHAGSIQLMPKYYILKCRVHGGEIYSLTEDDDICGGCAQKLHRSNK